MASSKDEWKSLAEAGGEKSPDGPVLIEVNALVF